MTESGQAQEGSEGPLRAVTWSGAQLTEVGESRLLVASPQAVLALQAGSGTALNPKRWRCEDSLSYSELAAGECLAVVADAHWGGASGEFVARELPGAFLATDAADPAVDRLRAALFDAAHAWRGDPRAAADPSETTVLAVHLSGRHLAWVSVGDSLAAIVHRDDWRTLNPLRDVYLGAGELAQDQVDSGAAEVPPGGVVLLATDGLESRASQLEREDVVRLLGTEAALEERVRRLALRADDPRRGAGRDNLALVALQPLATL